ncbi:dephospho-CoA kinase [Candidatus Latescibacterota bacterium]
MILGITGCPGSGKSVLAKTVARYGWNLIDADDIGREVVEGNSSIIEALADAFGNDIIGQDGTLDRRLVARRVFVSPEETAKLNSIVHPRLISLLVERIEVLRVRNVRAVVDCALIFEWGIEDVFDLVVCVQAGHEFRIKRIMNRDGRTREEIEGFYTAQLPEAEKVRRSDLVITNNGSLERLEAFARLLSLLPDVMPGKR